MTTASILAHPPSQAIARRAEILASTAYFSALSQHNGEFYGSVPSADGIPIKVYFSPSRKRFACACNMRQQPCFHALSLALLSVNHPESFPSGEPVEDAPAHSLPTTLSNNHLQQTAEQAQADKQQRRLQRLERAIAGFDDLEAWMDDVVRRGLGTVYQESPKFAEHIAARMADASLGGLARKLRLFQAQALSGDAWTTVVIAALAELKAVVAIFRKRTEIQEGLFADLMDYCGINMRKEDVLAEGEPISDNWAVIGWKEDILEDRLEMRRTWLFGLHTRRFALILDYGFGSGGLPPRFEFGHQLQAEVVFYPSALPLRVLIRSVMSSNSAELQPNDLSVAACRHWQEVQAGFARGLSACPWLYSIPVMVSGIITRSNPTEDTFYLIDSQGNAATARASHEMYMKLLSFSRGRAITVAGEWDAQYFTTYAAFNDSEMMHLL